MGAGVIDSDYRGELGVVLFNFGNEEFIVNMGDKIAQLIFERIKTPVIKETNELEGTGRGDKGYGNTGVSATSTQDCKTQSSNAVQKSVCQREDQEISMNKSEQKQSQLHQTRQIISAVSSRN